MMKYEDTYRVRQLNDIKVQHEIQTIDLLQRSLKESGENTNKMTNILSNFETRLTALHDLIVPVYDATNTLQIKHQNINKTVSKLDNIIEYYNSVKNLSLVIQAGPGKDINTYISQLNKLRQAIEYFAANKNQSQKKQNEELWQQGKQNVDREFDQLLNKFAETTFTFVENNEALSLEQLVDATNSNFRENDLNQINSIFEWFKQIEPSYLDKLYERLIKNRSELILEKLKKIKEKVGSLNGSGLNIITPILPSQAENRAATIKRNTSMMPSASSANFATLNNSIEDKKSTIRSRLTDMRRKKSSSANLNEANTMATNSAPSRAPNLVTIEHDYDTNDWARFIQGVRRSIRMFYVEHNFMSKIIESNNDKIMKSKILERIFDPVMRFLINDAQRLSGNIKQIRSKFTSKYVIAMFKALSELVQLKASFLRVFDHSTLITKTSTHINNSIEHLLNLFAVLENSCVCTLAEIIEEIKQDPQTIQPNGNIHPITTETITFIKNLLPFDIIAGQIANSAVRFIDNKGDLVLPSDVEIQLRREASKNKEFTQIAYQVNSEEEKKDYRVALAEYFYKLFRWLNLNLKNKAENYEDPNLKWIFLLNNAYKISKLFNDQNNSMMMKKTSQSNGKCETLNDLFVLVGKRDLKSFYDQEILNFKREYSKCWSKLLSYIKDLNENNPFNETKLKDKERQLLKDRFSAFNKEFEEIYETQKKYYIPAEQNELAEILRQDNAIYIITQYKRFYDRYARLNFATNRDKYIKYSPEELTAKMNEFFNAY